MKAAIVALSGALALVVLAVGCKNGPGKIVPGGIEQSFAGSSLVIAADPAGKVTTIHHLVATGDPGNAHIEALLQFKSHGPSATEDSRCDKRFKYGASLISLTWVQVYHDGSAFTGAVETESLEDAVVCTDGRNFYLNVRGPIVEVSGPRFESFQEGVWTVVARIGHALTTGTVTADFREKAAGSNR